MEIERMRELLNQASVKIKEQEQALIALTSPPFTFAIIQKVNGSTVLATVDGKMMELTFDPRIKKQLRPGSFAQLNEAGAIVGVSKVYADAGGISTVTRIVDDAMCEVETEGSAQVVYYDSPVEEGDRVVVFAGIIITKNFGKNERNYINAPTVAVGWDDIGGLGDAKQAMIEAIEYPIKHAALSAKYGKKPCKGIMLYGPPGCGKTMLGKAAATAQARLHGESASSGFIYVKGPEILDRYVGVSEARVRQLFKASAEHDEKHGYPGIIFIDEADALLGKRGERASMGIEQTIVPAFLAEMDGLIDSKAMVILATNRPDTLDDAVVRDGRIDRRIMVERPDSDNSKEIAYLHFEKRPLHQKVTREEAANIAIEMMFSEDNTLFEITGKKTHNFTLGHVMNGAMIAGMIDKASSNAFNRELAGDKEEGITLEDLNQAVALCFRESRGVNHKDDLRNFITARGEEQVSVKEKGLN